jgi:hypothetical protein
LNKPSLRARHYAGLLLLAAAVLLSSCEGLAGEPRIIATIAPQLTVENAAGTLNTAPESTQVVAAEDEVLGIVSGQVTNGSAGGTLPASLTLSLHVIKSETEGLAFDGLMSADGSFLFESVPFNASYQYIVIAPYNGITFRSAVVAADPTTPELNLPVSIYEIGASESAVQIDAVSSQVIVQDELQVFEIVSFVNTSDRVYFNVADDAATSVQLSLPQGATLLNNDSSAYLISSDGTQIYSTRPLLPGTPLVLHLAYTLPYNGSASVDQTFVYPLDGSVEIVLLTDGLSVAGENIAEQEQITLGDRLMTRYGGHISQEAAAAFQFTVTGLPAAEPVVESSPSINTIIYGLIAIGLSTLVLATIVTLRQRQSDKRTIATLLEQIALLDEEQATGHFDAQEYEQKRNTLKAQLSTLVKL